MASKTKSARKSKSNKSGSGKDDNGFKVLKRIGKIKREGRTALRIAVQEIKDKGACIDLRVWYFKENDPELKPTPKGICLNADEIPAVCRMLKKAAKFANAQ